MLRPAGGLPRPRGTLTNTGAICHLRATFPLTHPPIAPYHIAMDFLPLARRRVASAACVARAQLRGVHADIRPGLAATD